MTKRMRTMLVVASVVMAFLTGCAGNMSRIPNKDELAGVVGMSDKAVLQKFGEPTRKKETSELWQWFYEKATNNATNTFGKIISAGFAPPLYVDKVTLTLEGKKNKVVTDYNIEDAVTAINLPGIK